MTDPNIVLLTWDSVRADHMPFHGYHRTTAPQLTALADEGLVVEDCQVPGVGTPTSLTGAFTGRHAAAIQTDVRPAHWAEANANRTLLSERLSDHGYHTGAIHHNALMSRDWGWNRGWDYFEDGLWTNRAGGDEGLLRRLHDAFQRFGVANAAVHAKKMAAGAPPDRWSSLWDDVAAFVDGASEPFFLWILLIDTHHPWFAPTEFHQWPQPGARRMYALNYVMRRYPRVVGRRHASIVNAYDNAIRYADCFIDHLVDYLDDCGHDSPALIVHGDHGDELGEHLPRPYGHRPLMYDTVTRVPLVMHNVGETGRLAGPNTLLDLPSTILDLAGSDERPGGRPSLLDRPDHGHVAVQNYLLSDDVMAAVAGAEWKVVYHPGEGYAAYYRPDDRFEQSDRWGEHPGHLGRRLSRRVDRLRSMSPDGADEPGVISDALAAERLAELGYID